MDVSKIVAEIDEKIASLQQARAVLVDLDESALSSKPRQAHRRCDETPVGRATQGSFEGSEESCRKKRSCR
jgi:hypothetical protein